MQARTAIAYLGKLLSGIDLHNFIIITLCFIKRYGARWRLDKKSLGKLNWLSFISSYNNFVSKFIYWSKLTPGIFLAFENLGLTDTSSSCSLHKNPQLVVPHLPPQKFHNHFCVQIYLLIQTYTRYLFCTQKSWIMQARTAITFSSGKLPLKIDLYDFIIITLCFIKRYRARWRLD